MAEFECTDFGMGLLAFCSLFQSRVVVPKLQCASEFLFRDAHKLYVMPELTSFPRQFCFYQIFILESTLLLLHKRSISFVYFVDNFHFRSSIELLIERTCRYAFEYISQNREKFSSNVQNFALVNRLLCFGLMIAFIYLLMVRTALSPSPPNLPDKHSPKSPNDMYYANCSL